MINTSMNMSSTLASIYTTNNNSLGQTMERIATGKRVTTPSDDFASFIRGSQLNADIEEFNGVKRNLQDAKAYTDYGKAVGNNILEDLAKLKVLEQQYSALADPTVADLDEATALTAQFDAIVAGIGEQIASSAYDGTAIYDIALAKTADIDADGNQITITPTAVADASALAIDGGVAAIQAEIDAGQTYVSDMESFGSQIDRAVKLADTVINSKQATVSAFMDINETEELSKMTNLQVRMQATVSMMSQANSSQAAIVKLFQ